MSAAASAAHSSQAHRLLGLSPPPPPAVLLLQGGTFKICLSNLLMSTEYLKWLLTPGADIVLLVTA